MTGCAFISRVYNDDNGSLPFLTPFVSFPLSGISVSFAKYGCQNPVMVHFFLSLAMGVNQTLIVKMEKISEKSL